MFSARLEPCPRWRADRQMLDLSTVPSAVDPVARRARCCKLAGRIVARTAARAPRERRSASGRCRRACDRRSRQATRPAGGCSRRGRSRWAAFQIVAEKASLGDPLWLAMNEAASRMANLLRSPAKVRRAVFCRFRWVRPARAWLRVANICTFPIAQSSELILSIGQRTLNDRLEVEMSVVPMNSQAAEWQKRRISAAAPAWSSIFCGPWWRSPIPAASTRRRAPSSGRRRPSRCR